MGKQQNLRFSVFVFCVKCFGCYSAELGMRDWSSISRGTASQLQSGRAISALCDSSQLSCDFDSC